MYNLRIQGPETFKEIKGKSINKRGYLNPNMPKLEWEDLISEHEGEGGNHSQSDINKSYKIEEERKFEFLWWIIVGVSGSDIHGRKLQLLWYSVRSRYWSHPRTQRCFKSS